jgi:hypothetical protein
MRTIIWGIAIVFCLQIGFQLAMTAQRSDADYAELRSPLQAGINMPSASLDADDLDTNIAPVEDESADALEPVQPRMPIRYVRVPERARPEPRPATTAFKPVVITYDRSGALTTASAKTPERRQPARTETPSDDKPSLIARAVTKPFDWLKAVGSKLH